MVRKFSSRKLQRSKSVYEFVVKYPWGGSSINGLRRAARHFGFHTRNDPAVEGTDSFRLLVHKDKTALRKAAVATLAAIRDAQDNDDMDFREFDALLQSRIHWFHHDWKHWDVEEDRNALRSMGLSAASVELHRENSGGYAIYRVTIRRVPRVSKKSARRGRR